MNNTATLLILSMLSAAMALEVSLNSCTCSEIPDLKECQTSNCEWNAETKKCEDLEPPHCDVITGSTSCASLSTCAWDAVNFKCNTFKDCTSYKGQSVGTCKAINLTCTYYDGTNCAKTKPSATCAERAATAQDCIYGSDGLCVLIEDPTTPKCQLYTNCSQGGTNAAQCDRNGSCEIIDGKCSQLECSAIKIQGDCTFTPNFGFTKATLCAWVDNKCVESDTKTLTEANCFTSSAGSHVWKDNKCQECTEDSTLLGIVGLSLMVMFL